MAYDTKVEVYRLTMDSLVNNIRDFVHLDLMIKYKSWAMENNIDVVVHRNNLCFEKAEDAVLFKLKFKV